MSELFDRFEVNRAPRWPLMSRLVALSLVLHGVFLVAVVYVPTLRGLLRVATAMSGIEFVSEDYDKSLLGQRATIIKLEPHEKLYYPPDYFGAPAVEETTQLQPEVVQQAAPPPPPPPSFPEPGSGPPPPGPSSSGKSSSSSRRRKNHTSHRISRPTSNTRKPTMKIHPSVDTARWYRHE
jgi:hypothetical protein